MSKCSVCKKDIPQYESYCPHCNAAAQAASQRVSSNPYSASQAVIDAGPAVYTGDPESPKYNMRFGVGETIGEAFSAWFESIGRLIVINLIPFAVIFVLAIIGIGVLVSVAIEKVPELLQQFTLDSISSFYTDIGVGIFVMFGVFFLTAVVFTIPAFMGQFKILDERRQGREHQTGVWQLYAAGFRYVLPLLGAGLLGYIVVTLLFVPTAFLGGSLPIIVLYIIMVLVAILFISIRLAVVFPIMILEQKALFPAIWASNHLVSGKTWTVMGIYVVLFVIVIGVGMGMGIVGLIPVLGQLVTIAVQLVLGPLQVAVMFAIYAGLKSNQSSF